VALVEEIVEVLVDSKPERDLVEAARVAKACSILDVATPT
jgi:hypothetical protein